MKIISSFLILFGILLLILSTNLTIQKFNPYRLAFNEAPNVEITNSSKNPVKVTIKDLNIDLPVKKAKIDSKKWQTYTDALSYLSSSPAPGDEGNSIIYGHNWKNLLGNLKKANIGQKITVEFSDGTKKDFETKYITEVKPSQVSILEKSNDKRITLYTCSGFLDSKRFVVVATLI